MMDIRFTHEMKTCFDTMSEDNKILMLLAIAKDLLKEGENHTAPVFQRPDFTHSLTTLRDEITVVYMQERELVRKKIYMLSFEEAERAGELQKFYENRYAYRDCARDITRAIDENFDGSHLRVDASEIVEMYGFDRVAIILAYTITRFDHDGRFSPENKAWAKTVLVPEGVSEMDTYVRSHPGLVNIFTTQFLELVKENLQSQK